MSYGNAKVFALVGDETACTYYRIINPLKILQQHGLDVTFGKGLDGPGAEQANIVFMGRASSEVVLDRVCRLGWRNTRIIYDIDDDFDHIEKSNPAYGMYHGENKKVLTTVKDIMSMSAGVIVSTEELQKWYKQTNQNIEVFDNYIDYSLRDWSVDVQWDGINPMFALKPIISKHPGTFTFGYSGSTSHLADFQLVGPAIRQFLDKYQNCRFLFNSSEPFFKQVMEFYKFPEDKVEFVPAVHFTKHPELLKGVDVWLAPVITNQFNLAKTSLKLKETLAAGSVAIGSCIANYAKFHAKYSNSTILIGDNEFCCPSWIQALEWLYHNPDVMEKMKLEGRREMIQKESIEQNCHRWVHVVDNICKTVDTGKAWKSKPMSPSEHLSYKMVKPNDPCPVLKDVKYKKGYTGAYG